MSMIVSIMYFGEVEDGEGQANEDISIVADAITSAVISIPVLTVKFITGTVIERVARREGISQVKWVLSPELYKEHR